MLRSSQFPAVTSACQVPLASICIDLGVVQVFLNHARGIREITDRTHSVRQVPRCVAGRIWRSVYQFLQSAVHAFFQGTPAPSLIADTT
jgi:hypothetical protein